MAYQTSFNGTTYKMGDIVLAAYRDSSGTTQIVPAIVRNTDSTNGAGASLYILDDDVRATNEDDATGQVYNVTWAGSGVSDSDALPLQRWMARP